MITSNNDIEQRARRAAKRVGLIAKKSRWRVGSIDNRGGFMVIEPYSNGVVCGSRFDLSAQDVLDYCELRSSAANGSGAYPDPVPSQRTVIGCRDDR